MSRTLTSLIACLFVAVCLEGCSSASPNAAFARVRSLSADRLGMHVRWNAGSAEDAAADQAVRDLLSRPLTADAAVQIALLNNHSLQASFEELGIAQADFVQAGLLQNPVFSLSVRFPNERPSRTYLDLGAAENFLNIFLIPARRKIAAAQLDEAVARVTDEVLSLGAKTRESFYACEAAQQTVELRRTIADAAAAALEAAARLREAGNTTELDYYAQRAQAARARAELTTARAQADGAREQLSGLLGVWGAQADWKVDGRLPDPPPDEIRTQDLEALALRQRMDLAAARQEVLAQARMYGFTVDTRWFAQADLGIEAERETDGQWRIGPTLSIPIPLFDQGQAAVPRAAATFRQSRQRYLALAAEIRSQVRAARARMLNARAAAQLYRDEVIPTQQKYLQQAQLQYNGMFVSVFRLLEARRDQIDAGVQYVQALRAYWTSRAELERAIGGRVPPGEPSGPTTHATSLPATQPAVQHEAHEHHHGERS